MNRRKLGPPPSWIPANEAQRESDAGEAADPLKNIFSASRTARLGDQEDNVLLEAYQARREAVTDVTLLAEMNAMLMAEKRKRAPFTEILLSPSSNADVRDVRGTRLVILAYNHPHSPANGESIARKKAQAFLGHYGVGPRRYRNTLVFLAPDSGKLQELMEELRSMLAWRSLVELPGGLEYRLIERCRAQVNRFVERREDSLREAFGWILVPTQAEPGAPVEWKEVPMAAGSRTLAECAAQTLSAAGLLRTDDLGLAEDIDAAALWLGDSIHSGAQMAEEFARHLYLPRLIDDRILQSALQTALSAAIKPRGAAAGPKRLYSAILRLDQNDLARIAPQLLSHLTTLVSPVDLKLTLHIDALVPDSVRTQLEGLINDQGGKA